MFDLSAHSVFFRVFRVFRGSALALTTENTEYTEDTECAWNTKHHEQTQTIHAVDRYQQALSLAY